MNSNSKVPAIKRAPASLVDAGAGVAVLVLALACLISAALLLLAAPAQAQAAGSPSVGIVTFKVQQIFTGPGVPTTNPDRTCSYQLTAQPISNPMPFSRTRSNYVFSIEGDADSDIGPIAFTEPGIYSYEIRNTTNPKPYYTYDQTIYTVDIWVTRDLSCGMVVYREDGEKTTEIQYAHAYDAADIEFPDDGPKPPIRPPVESPIRPPKSAGNKSPIREIKMEKTGDGTQLLLGSVLLLIAIVVLLTGTNQSSSDKQGKT